jgi:phytoene dehydrogenase-like protein
MNHEVIVVGGGIGGLTVAALLAARGVDVCLFERESHVGGCVAKFEHLGQAFDPTFGLYSGWEAGGVWERVFAELTVAPPPVTKLSPNFVVRLPDGTHVPVSSDHEALEHGILNAFPECAGRAVHFIRGALECRADLESLKKTSENFRAFVDAQLTFLTQRTIENAEPSRINDPLSFAMGDLWEIAGGAQSLADRLATSFKQSGGNLRLNSPVLRLAYADDGTPNGVDLLSGECITATRAIISNLTVWDTYGKLVGLRRTPPAISAQLKQMSAWGVYQVFMLIDEAAVATLPSRRMIFASSAQETSPPAHMFLNIQSPNDQAQSAGKRRATLSEFTDVDDWFAFHEDSSSHEEQDQAMLEKIWARLHAAAPDVSNGAEVFETATPQTYYESVRRKMGMIGSPTPGLSQSSTHLDKLFLVGDTAAQTIGLAGVADAAHRLACSLTD